MRDTLIGLITMVILFSMVWLSQSNASKSKNIVETDDQKYTIGNNEPSNVIVNNKIPQEDSGVKGINESHLYQNETIAPCELCDKEIEVSGNFTFGQAFNLCRQCLGDDRVFLWQNKLYSTNIKTVVKNNKISDKNHIQINLVKNETTESPDPPISNTKSVVSQ